MGYLEGMLGGFTSRKREVELQNLAEAQRSQEQEGRLLEHLINSPDPEIKSMAVAGLLESANPKRRKGGLSGWLGQMESNPHLDRIRGLLASEGAGGGAAAPTEMIAQPPNVAAPLAQAATSPTEVGSPPPTQTTPVPAASPLQTTSGAMLEPLPGQTPPINPSMVTPSPGPTARGQALQVEAGAAPISPTTVGAAPPTAIPGAPPLAVLGQETRPLTAVERQTPATGTSRGRRTREVFQTPEGQIRLSKKAAAQGDVEGEVEGLVASGVPRSEAIQVVKRRMLGRGGGVMGYQSVAGQVTDPETGKTTLVNGAFDRTTGQYIGTDPDSDYYGIPIPGFVSRQAASGLRTAGMDREAIALADYGMRFEDLAKSNPAAARAVIEKEKVIVAGKAQARGAGAGQAAFEKPIGVTEAQKTNVPVGSTSAQFAGQQVASEVEQARRRGVENVNTQLDHIKTLLVALPRQGDLQGLLPGAALAFRRRSPQYRTQVAQLDSAIDNILASLSRTIQENRGAQTEKDAERAYSTIASMKGRLLDPASGDTQESAAARIAETQGYLKTILSTLPGNPVPNAIGAPPPMAVATPSGPSVAGPGGGWQMVNGVLHFNGKPY